MNSSQATAAVTEVSGPRAWDEHARGIGELGDVCQYLIDTSGTQATAATALALRVTNAESAATALALRVTNAETAATALALRVTNAETAATALASAVTALALRVTALEGP